MRRQIIRQMQRSEPACQQHWKRRSVRGRSLNDRQSLGQFHDPLSIHEVENRQAGSRDLGADYLRLLLRDAKMVRPPEHFLYRRTQQAANVRDRLQYEIAVTAVNSIELNVRIENLYVASLADELLEQRDN